MRCRILGENNKNLGKIVQIVGIVLSRGSLLAEQETIAKMVTLLNQMQASLPPEVHSTVELIRRCGLLGVEQPVCKQSLATWSPNADARCKDD